MCGLCVYLLSIGPYMCTGFYILAGRLGVCVCDSCFGHKPTGLVCRYICVICWDTCALSPVRLDHMSHIISPACVNQLSPITTCNRFCVSGIAGVTSQYFNSGITKKICGSPIWGACLCIVWRPNQLWTGIWRGHWQLDDLHCFCLCIWYQSCWPRGWRRCRRCHGGRGLWCVGLCDKIVVGDFSWLF